MIKYLFNHNDCSIIYAGHEVNILKGVFTKWAK